MDQTRMEMFKKVIDMDPNDPLMHYGLGLEYAKADMHAEAAASLKKALEFKDDYSAAYRELGKALTALGQTDEAVPVYEKGIPIAENNGDIQTAKEMRIFLKRITGDEECGTQATP